MREHPIIFSAPMVRAILEGRKTQTRRVVRGGQPKGVGTFHVDTGFKGGRPTLVETTPCPAGHEIHWLQRMPYGQPGDRLWVREAHSIHNAHGQHRTDDKRWGPWGGLPTKVSPDGTQIAYFREGFDRCDPGRWRPSIHMPRWASRITLEITDVRVQRVQDISEEDAIAEGIRELPLQERELGAWWCADPLGNPSLHYRTPRAAFAALWDSLNEKRGFGWNANPYVWALTFKRVEQST